LKPWDRQKRSRLVISPSERWAQEIGDALLADCHPWQRDALEDPARFFTWLVGRGGGKTTALKAKFIRGMARVVRGRFVYVTTTLGAAVDLLWDPAKATCEALGVLDEVDFKEVGKVMTFKRTGARLKLFGADDRREMDKLRGQPFDGVGMDEVASFPPDLLDWFVDRIITPRLGERQGWFGMTGTPGHELRGRFYECTRPGSPTHRPYALRSDPEYADWKGWSSHHWTNEDVAALPDAQARYPAIVANWNAALEVKRTNGWTDDNPIWQREYLGRWATDATTTVYTYRPHVDGKPWNQWDPERVGPLRIARLPAEYDDWNYGVGVDLGSKDPFALQVFAVSPSDPSRTLYHVHEFERPKMYAKTIAQHMLGEELDHDRPGGLFGAIGWPNGIVVDAAQLGGNFVDELSNVYGIKCVAAERAPGQKHSAIELFNGDLVDGRVKVLKGSVLEQQLQQLRWKEDEYRLVKEDKAQANHSTDAAIYARKVLAPLLLSDRREGERPAHQPSVQPPSSPDEPTPRAPRNVYESHRAPSFFDDPFA